MALAAKRGEFDPSRLWGAAREMYETMTEQQLEDYAATPVRDLPEHKQD
jgi:Protein of unknwon function (DUF3008)